MKTEMEKVGRRRKQKRKEKKENKAKERESLEGDT